MLFNAFIIFFINITTQSVPHNSASDYFYVTQILLISGIEDSRLYANIYYHFYFPKTLCIS